MGIERPREAIERGRIQRLQGRAFDGAELQALGPQRQWSYRGRSLACASRRSRRERWRRLEALILSSPQVRRSLGSSASLTRRAASRRAGHVQRWMVHSSNPAGGLTF
jgi:hypothetical protein